MAPKINIESITKLPTSKKALILAGINVFILVVVYWFLIGPKYGEVKRLKVDLQDLTAKLNENRAIAADIPKFLHERDELEAKLKAAVAELPNEKEIPDLIDSISRAGEKSGLKILLFKPAPEVSKGFYAEVPVNMMVQGRFESLYDFSVKISKLSRIVNISSMSIVSEGHRNRVPILKAEFVTTTFRFLSAPSGAQSKTK
jgi:type IV pilus assembly protein PilO